jgi:hypothetical protein
MPIIILASSSSAKADDPVIGVVSVLLDGADAVRSAITGCPDFAGGQE